MAIQLAGAVVKNAVGDLTAIRPILSCAIQQFARNIETAATRRNRGKPRGRPALSRMPGPPGGRIAYHATAMPRRLRTGIPPTVVRRQPGATTQPAFAKQIEAGAQQVATTIQNKLLDFRSGLQNLETDLQLGTTILQAELGSRTSTPVLSHSTEEKIFSALALIIAVGVVLGTMGVQARHSPLTLDAPGLEQKIGAIAEAIAVAEGYYAPGTHDGHSLPYTINNPGSLKKPALGADALPTWKDTGLVVFPEKESGWAALRHQVGLMLTGHSSVYSLSDTLERIAAKYADGDANWGKNVAAQLRISTNTTLADIAAQPKAPSPPPVVEAKRTLAAEVSPSGQ